ncbi:related to Salicylate hydroxylase [Ustilago trichophora]|uniref:Related to Salicylate hydroxylase n=1 Tax=Ustilago trichophora TaxID=86804 RepID=A0A5C3E6P5_9BASI|nr:related to Salicylate hydroxylase [Ustilago trichophora]
MCDGARSGTYEEGGWGLGGTTRVHHLGSTESGLTRKSVCLNLFLAKGAYNARESRLLSPRFISLPHLDDPYHLSPPTTASDIDTDPPLSQHLDSLCRSTRHVFCPKKDFQVAIIGGGIGGLTLAIGLHDRGVPVHIFESAPKFAEIGAGIAIGPNAQNALQRLNLYDSFLGFADFQERNLFFQWRLAEPEEQTLLSETICKKYGMASIHRAELLDTFIQKVPKQICSFGKRLKSIEQPTEQEGGKVKLTFEDGSTHEADLVIGCDVAGSDSLVWSGTWAYRGLIPREQFVEALGKEKGELYADTAQMMLAKDSHILIFPIQGGKTVNIATLDSETTQQALLDDFSTYSSDLIKVLKCIEKPSKWALHQHTAVYRTKAPWQAKPSKTPSSSPTSSPIQGQQRQLGQSVQVYDKIRVPRANRVLETSLEAGETYEFRGVAADDPHALGQHLVERFDHIWDYDHDQEKKDMEDWLEANL